MKNGAINFTSGFENQLPSSTQIEPIELIHDIFFMFDSSNIDTNVSGFSRAENWSTLSFDEKIWKFEKLIKLMMYDIFHLQ